jgi:hypothetical protein
MRVHYIFNSYFTDRNYKSFFNLYNKEDQQLYKLSLSKLQYEYRKFKLQGHPHGEFDSIRWV